MSTPLDDNGPTPPEMIEAWQENDSTFWASGCGHHQNAVDMLYEDRQRLREDRKRLQGEKVLMRGVLILVSNNEMLQEQAPDLIKLVNSSLLATENFLAIHD